MSDLPLEATAQGLVEYYSRPGHCPTIHQHEILEVARAFLAAARQLQQRELLEDERDNLRSLRLVLCGGSAVEALGLDENSDSAADVKQAIERLKAEREAQEDVITEWKARHAGMKAALSERLDLLKAELTAKEREIEKLREQLKGRE